MRRTHLWTWAVVVCLFSAPIVCAQSQPASDVSSAPASVAAVPRLIKFSGRVLDARGEPLGNVAVRLTFAVYSEQQGGAALWAETQMVQLDEQGHYAVLLGATRADGLPVELFPAGKARWLGVQVEGRDEDSRVLLVSVPYALKAEDAAMLGGRQASDFVLGEQLKEEVRTQVAAQTPGIAAQTVEMLVGNPPKAPAIAEGPSTFTCATTGNCVMVQQNGTGRAMSTSAVSSGDVVLVQQTGTGIGLWALAAGNVAVYGQITGSAGTSYGVKGLTTSTTGAGVFGYNQATTGLAYGVLGQTKSTEGTAFFGRALATTGATIGLRGHSDSTSGTGIMGQATATSGTTTGILGRVFSVNGTALIVDNTQSGKLLSGQANGVEKLSVDGSGNLVASGSVTATSFSGGGTLSGTQLISTVASGTAPLQVASTTLVPNLNADTLDGLHASAFQPAGAYATLGGNTFAATQTISSGNLSLPETTGASTGVINLGGAPFIHACCSAAQQNTFVGPNAGNFTTTGGWNTASGYEALYANTTGGANTASGYQALYMNTEGGANTASGAGALYSNTTGIFNTASGGWTLYSNTTGSLNTASGAGALQLNTTGGWNTASGFQALYHNTEGNNNTASGQQALFSNTTGSQNTASGFEALHVNTMGNMNTASGAYALHDNTTGQSNTVSGYQALKANTTGTFNTASGAGALSSNTEGNNNTAIGFGSGGNNTTGSDNTFIGFQAGPSSGDLINATAIGANAVVSQSNSLVLGNGANVGIGTTTPAHTLDVVGDIHSSGSVTATSFVGALSGIASGLDCTGCVSPPELDFNPATQEELNTESAARVTADITLQAGIEGRVLKSGDTMAGTLTLPADGLVVGSNQLVATGGKVGIGVSGTPAEKLEVNGTVKATGFSGDGSGLTNIQGSQIVNTVNTLQVALLKWYPANQAAAFAVGTQPYGVAFDGANIWVSNWGSNNVTKLRASDGANLGTFAVGTHPSTVAFDGANIWVSNYGSNNVSKLRASDGENLGTFAVGANPSGVAFDGANLWVANYGSINVTKLRASDGANLGTFAVGNSPSGVAFDGANIWVTNSNSNNVTKLLASDGANLGTFAVGSQPWAAAFDGANIWVTNASSGTVSKL